MSATAQAKPKSKKTVASKKPLSHPTFAEMITEAIVSLKERTGSSQYAVTKFIEAKHKELPPTFRKLVLQHIKKGVAAGKFVKVKNSFKLAPTRAAPAKIATAAAKKPKAVSKSTAKAAASKPKAKPKAAAAKPTAKPKAKAAKAAPAKKVVAKPAKKVVSKPAKKVVSKPAKKVPVKSVKKPKSVKTPVKKAKK